MSNRPRESHRGDEPVVIEELLRAALDDAGIFEDTAVLFIIAGQPPAGAAEYAYLPPGAWGNLMNRVLYDVGPRIHEFSSVHRFATYSELPDAPEAGIADGFRHEAQHAVQFNEFGHGLFNPRAFSDSRCAEGTN